MAIQTIDGFYVGSAAPIDDRFIAANLTARNALQASLRYEGLIVYVAAEQTSYQLQGGITNSDWSEFPDESFVQLVDADGDTRMSVEQPPGTDTDEIVLKCNNVDILVASETEVVIADKLLVGTSTACDLLVPYTSSSGLVFRLINDSYKHVFQKTDGGEVASIDASGNVIALGTVKIGAGEAQLIESGGALYFKNTGNTDYINILAKRGTFSDGMQVSPGKLVMLDSNGATRAYLKSEDESKQIDFGCDGSIAMSLASRGLLSLNQGSTITDTGDGIEIFNPDTLAAESLTEIDFATSANWDDLGDANSTGGSAEFVHSGGTGSITQTAANQATPAVDGGWYLLIYDMITPEGDMQGVLTTDYAADAQNLDMVAGLAKELVFKASATPVDFKISSTSSTGRFVVDNVSLKQIVGAKCLNVHGSVIAGTTLQVDGTSIFTGQITAGIVSATNLYALGTCQISTILTRQTAHDMLFQIRDVGKKFTYRDKDNNEISALDAQGRLSLNQGSTITDTGDGVEIFNPDTLAAESLTEIDFATSANWDDLGDANSTGGSAEFVHSGGTGSITQTAANQATPAVAGGWYLLIYDMITPEGDMQGVLTTDYAAEAQNLDMVAGLAKELVFKASSTPVDFKISSTSSTGRFGVDNVSLKQIVGAKCLNIHGDLQVGGDVGNRLRSVADYLEVRAPDNLSRKDFLCTKLTATYCEASVFNPAGASADIILKQKNDAYGTEIQRSDGVAVMKIDGDANISQISPIYKGKNTRKPYEILSPVLSGSIVDVDIDILGGEMIVQANPKVETTITSGDGATSANIAFIDGATDTIKADLGFTRDSSVVKMLSIETSGLTKIRISTDNPGTNTFSGGRIAIVVFTEAGEDMANFTP